MFNFKKKQEAEFMYGREGIILKPVEKVHEEVKITVVNSSVTDLSFNSVLQRWE